VSKLVLNGDTSGSVTLDAPAVSGTTTLTLPTTSATLITDSSGVLNIGSGQLYKDASGNVGIGITAPTSKLNVQSASGNYATFSTSGTNKLFVGVDNGTPELVVGASAGDAVIRTQQQLWFGLNDGGVAGRFDSSGNFYMNSGYGSVATAYGCRAWVNFNGTGTPAIRASGNVSSITDNGTGDYTVNFTTAMPDDNYSTIFGRGQIAAGNNNNIFGVNNTGGQTASSVRTLNISGATSAGNDIALLLVAIFR